MATLTVFVGGTTPAEAISAAQARVAAGDSNERVWEAVPGTFGIRRADHRSIGCTTRGADGQGYLRAERWVTWEVEFDTVRKLATAVWA